MRLLQQGMTLLAAIFCRQINQVPTTKETLETCCMRDGISLSPTHPARICVIVAYVTYTQTLLGGANWRMQLNFLNCFLDIDIPRVAIENPIMHKYGKQLIGGVKQNQVVQPWMFGHPETKATCLWLRGLPNLIETNNVKGELEGMHKRDIQRLHYLPPSPERAKIRSKTYQGLADAMASQWGINEMV